MDTITSSTTARPPTVGEATTVYTDGSCLGNPGPGGWAWAVPGGPWASGADPQATNNRMKLAAVLAALRAVDGPLVVVSDATYVVDSITRRRYVDWQRNGWRKPTGDPVRNRDLWEPLAGLIDTRAGELEFRWLRGSDRDPAHVLVDGLARQAATSQCARHGDTPIGLHVPAEAGRRRATARTGPDAPAGHLVAVFGHRLAELGGYDDDNPVTAAVQRRLTAILRDLRIARPDLRVLTGLGLGAEQLAASAAAHAGVPYVAVLPFPGQATIWPQDRRATYERLLAGAATTITLSADAPANRSAAGKAIGRRNDWMVAHAHTAIVVWDGQDATLGALVRALQRRIPDNLQIVSPRPSVD